MSDGPSPTIAYHRPPSEPDLEATVAAVPTESGGRRYALFSGYRPMHAFGVSGTLYDALHEYPDGPVEPGQSGRALLWLNGPVGILVQRDRKSTRLNSSHPSNSYAGCCLKKKMEYS